jgi:hypothetical protein
MLQKAQEFAHLAAVGESDAMRIAQTSAPAISEPMTWNEICERYPNEWVCLVEFDRIDPDRFAFRTARVVGHSKHRRTAVEQSRSWWRSYEEIGQHFTTRVEPCAPWRQRPLVRIDLPWNRVQR